MSERIPELLIKDILTAADRIIIYTSGIGLDDFLNDAKTKDAVIRNFKIIGEASRRLPQPYKEIHTSIDWDGIRGFRNRIVHEYFGINYSVVWELIEEYIPILIHQLKSL